jgi:hypothetical protein
LWLLPPFTMPSASIIPACMLALLPTADLEKHVADCAISLEGAESFGCFTDPTASTRPHG